MISAINKKKEKKDYVMMIFQKSVNYESYGLSKLKYLYSDKSKMKKELTQRVIETISIVSKEISPFRLHMVKYCIK